MSVWMIALGLSAGYLINKKFQMEQLVDESVKEYVSHAKPANSQSDWAETQEIRRVQRTVPDGVKFQDINVSELPPGEVKKLTALGETHHEQTALYEGGPGPIQGVWLNFGDRGS